LGALFRDVCGAKAHVVYDPDLGCPIYHMITEATVNDITAAKAMPIEAGATYVFDLGYYDYAWWAELDDADCRIVTRFKKIRRCIRPHPCLSSLQWVFVSDSIGSCRAVRPKPQKPHVGAVREIVVTMETGGTLRILSNDWTHPPRKSRPLQATLANRTVFRVMKQTLKINPFYRSFRKRRSHSDRRRADRFPAAGEC